jgi:peptidoglycan hydrolase-like protein with peptidoglycan-binding domain
LAKSTAGKSATVKSTAKPSTAKTVVATSTSAKTTAAKRIASKTGAKQSASSYHPAPQQPTTDRYKEIQQALADKGYFGGPVDGNWGPSSTDALKRFQHDQNLLEDGKVGSLSLIALGLGPKRGTAATNPARAQPPAQPPAPPPQPEPPQ